jgi:hypothetical protein
MSAPAFDGVAPVPLQSAGGSGACCAESKSAAKIAAVAWHGRGALRTSLCGGAETESGRVDAPEQGGRPALPTRLAATSLRRGARRPREPASSPLQKEHPA